MLGEQLGKFFLFFVFFVGSCTLHAKVRVLTFHFNMPEFIELQHKCLKTFLVDDYEMIVFNDSPFPHHEKNIHDVCQRLGIRCICYNQEWHFADPLNHQIKAWLDDPDVYSHLLFNREENRSVTLNQIARQPSIRHSHVIQYALDYFAYDHDDLVVIMDGDTFITREVHLKEIMKHVPLMGALQSIWYEYMDYLWVPFIVFDPTRLPNLNDLKFHPAVIEGKLHDTGSQTYHYIRDNPIVEYLGYEQDLSSNYLNYSVEDLLAIGFSGYEAWFLRTFPRNQRVEFYMNHSVLHFGSSSFELGGHKEKAMKLQEFLEQITYVNNEG